MMTHSLHTINTPHDAELASVGGLGPIHADVESCENCGNLVAEHDGKFTPMVIVLNEQDHKTTLCLTCIAPILRPGTVSTME